MNDESDLYPADKVIYPILFACSIYIIYMWTLLLTESLLVPWDIIPGRPPRGDIQRTINDFFETPPGAHLLAKIILASMICSFLWRMFKQPSIKLIRELTITNYLFLLADFSLGLLLRLAQHLLAISDPWPEIEFNFARIIHFIAMLVILCWVQWRGPPTIYLKLYQLSVQKFRRKNVQRRSTSRRPAQ